MTLDEVARRTKISMVTLHAIEHNQFERVPSGIFVRGYLRAYATAVGVDPEEIVRQYIEQYDPPPPVDAAARRAESARGDRHEPAPSGLPDPDAEHRRKVAWTAASIVVLAGGVIYSVWVAREFPNIVNASTHFSGDAASRTAIPPPEQAHPAPPAIAPIAGAPTTGDGKAQEPENGNGTVRLELRPSGPCWVSALADGQQVIYRLMAPDEHMPVDAREEIVLRVGDASTCAFSVNGSRARLLGGAGEPKTVHITPKNASEFLDR
jgi:hypothetical protein